MSNGTGEIGSRSGIGPSTLSRSTGDRQYVSVTDVISEGPIEGLVNGTNSIFLNNDTLDDVDNSPLSLSRGEMKLSLEKGSKDGTVVNSNLTNPFPNLSENEAIVRGHADMFVLVRNVFGTTTVYSSNRVNPGRGDRRYISLSTLSGFFTSDMLTLVKNNYGRYFPSEEQKRAKPVRLMPTTSGITLNDEPIEGYIHEKNDNGTQAIFVGYGEYAREIPEGTYTIEIDKYAKLALGTSGTTVKLAANWDFPASASSGTTTEYKFDLQGLNQDKKQRVSTNYSKHRDEASVEFRTGHLGQEPIQEMLQGGSAQTFAISGGDLKQINDGNISIPTNEPGIGGEVVLNGLVSGSKHFNLTASKMQSVDTVKFNISYPGGLKRINTKGEDAETVAVYFVDIGFKNPGDTNFGDYITIDEELEHKGKFNNAMTFQHSIELSKYRPFIDFRVRIRRRTDSGGDGYTGSRDRKGGHTNVSTAGVTQTIAVFNEKLFHPLTALGSLIFSTVNYQQIPSRTYDCRGLRIKVPSNYVTREENDSLQATYKRNTNNGSIETTEQDWDGGFRDGLVYTDNPAWIFYDMLTNNRYGLGEFLEDTDIDKYALYRIGRYCDELVDDGKGGKEPRYRLNAYFTKQVDAYKVMKDLATTFLGMLYFLDGKIFPVIDAPSSPVYNFTKGNVIDGTFTYESTGSKTRPNQYIVKWNNPENNYVLEPLIVEDSRNIAETERIISQTAVAFGCTSEGQATRYAKWKLWTAANQTEIVSFQTGINGSYLAPGDIVNIQDSDKSAARYGGRISKTGTLNTTTVPLDSPVTLTTGTSPSDYELTIVVNKPSAFALQDITIGAVNYSKGDAVLQAYIDSNGNGTYTLQDIDTEEKASQAFAVSNPGSSTEALLLNWKDDFRTETRTLHSTTSIGTAISTLTTATAFTTNPTREDIWVLKGIYNGLTISGSNKEYKVLSISQSDSNIYDITAVEHYNAKYDSIEGVFTTFVPNATIDVGQDAIGNSYSGSIPKAQSVKVIPGRDKQNDLEQLVLDWEHASSTLNSAARFEFLKGYEITTDIPGYDKIPVFVSKDEDTLYKFQEVEAGTYNFSIRTIDSENRASSPVIKSFTLVEEVFEKLANNVVAGGFVDGGFNDINDSSSSDFFSFKSRGYTFTPPQTFANEIINPESNDALTDDFKQDCGGLAYINWTAQNAEDAKTRFIHEHHYLLLDNDGSSSNAQNDYIKLVKYNPGFSDVFNLTTVPFWFDADDGSETVGLVRKSGTITKTDQSNTITGTGTSFLTDFAVGEIICATTTSQAVGNIIESNSVQAIYKIISIESDTKLTVGTGVGSFTDSRLGTNNIRIDIKQDAVIASIYRDSADTLFKIFYYAVRSLQGLPAPFLDYSNPTHSVYVDENGDADWQGTGGNLIITEGDIELTLNSTTQSTSFPGAVGTYNLDIVKVSGDNLIEPTIVNTLTVTSLGTFNGTLTETTVYRVTAYVKGLTGRTYSLNTDITLVPVSDGAIGPQGAVGQQGIQGAQGPVGNQGNQGAEGAQGIQGAQGSVGNQGNQGATGAQGQQGATGSQGATGNQGATGAQGQQGATGPQGAIGNQGSTGAQGAQGITGPQGNVGNQGATGIQGSDGPAGSAGNAIVFDTDNTVNSDDTGVTKSDLIRDFRGTNDLLQNDVYWHIQTGQVYQYQGSSVLNNENFNGDFTNLNNKLTGQSGFLSPDALKLGEGNDRVEFSSDGIKIYSGNVLRVIIGNLT